jgi:4,5-dihydroxyphthalate decarboxylase
MTSALLTLACGEYDRTHALADGSIRPDGFEIRYVAQNPGPLFARMVRERDFDVAEMSLCTYLNLRARDDDGLVGIPVFPSRVFRHGYIFVNRDSGILRMEDLAGRRIGTMQWQLTASLWMRGILAEEHGVPQSAIHWFVGGQDAPGEGERSPVDVPPDVRVDRIADDTSLGAMLAAGELDALLAPHIPDVFRARDRRVVRLFPDFRTVEAAWYRKRRLFPIMHLIVIRREVYEANPGLAAGLFRAFVAAKARARTRLQFTGTLAAMLPGLVGELEAAEELFGDRWWPYGVEANRPEIETAIRYAAEQGITRRPLAIAELFAPETLDLVDADGGSIEGRQAASATRARPVQ